MCSVHQRAPLAWSSWRSDNRYWVEGCSKCGTNHIIPDVKAGAYLIGQNPEDGVLQLERAEALRKTKQQLLRDSTAAKSRAERVILKRYAEALQEERAVLVQKVRSELLCGLKGTKNSWMIEYL